MRMSNSVGRRIAMRMSNSVGRRIAMRMYYRGIALISVLLKIYNRMLLTRLRVLDNDLRYNQNGFRPNRGTAEHILALRHLLDMCKTRKYLPMVFLFVDFSKAFDSVSFISIKRALEAWQISADFIDAILAPYNGHRVTISGCDAEFDLEQGVLQGDTVAPYLFLIVLDAILFKAFKEERGILIHQKGTRSRGKQTYLTDMDYADDLLILSHSVKDAQAQLHDLQKAASEVGLSINVGKGKTEYLTRNIKNPGTMVSLDGKEIERVESYKYLGANAFDALKDFNGRKGKAWAVLKRFEPLFKSKNVKAATKVKVALTMARSVFTYGGIIWPSTQVWTKRIDVAFTQMLRYAQNLPRAHTPLDVIYHYGHVPRLSNVLFHQRMATVGHALRHHTVFRTVIQLLTGQYEWPIRHQVYMDKVYTGRGPWAFWKVTQRELRMDADMIVEEAQDRRRWRDRIRRLAGEREEEFWQHHVDAHIQRSTQERRVTYQAWSAMAEYVAEQYASVPFHRMPLPDLGLRHGGHRFPPKRWVNYFDPRRFMTFEAKGMTYRTVSATHQHRKRGREDAVEGQSAQTPVQPAVQTTTRQRQRHYTKPRQPFTGDTLYELFCGQLIPVHPDLVASHPKRHLLRRLND